MKKTIKKHYKTLLPKAVNNEINERLARLEKEVKTGKEKIKQLKTKRESMNLPVVFTKQHILNTL